MPVPGRSNGRGRGGARRECYHAPTETKHSAESMPFCLGPGTLCTGTCGKSGGFGQGMGGAGAQGLSLIHI
eukprot:2158959-Rhodomonas_salina.1